ncbi:MAG: hypothetical protein M0Q24_10200 [Sulfurimonas sp.]|uniref:hypothetical protein n=1 Tax=Sulfurimonas sp. TaxID=2022749 RepID=UPI0025FBEC51|nr:hypothetical protein [Sulfurimonas sp.]MCK9492454.1 hypothetical protein [Sulfurimonas sp.]
MKKILLVGLFVMATSAIADKEMGCVETNLGDCNFFYSCKNNVSISIKKEVTGGNTKGPTCGKIVEKNIIVDKTKSVITIANPQG